MLAHFSYGGRTFQLAALPSAGSQAHRRVFERSIASFAPVRDPEILRVQPNRLDVMRLERAMSLEESSRTCRSAVPVRELAILNQVPGGGARLGAGTLVKRVVG